jgi:hypothetical protein
MGLKTLCWSLYIAFPKKIVDILHSILKMLFTTFHNITINCMYPIEDNTLPLFLELENGCIEIVWKELQLSTDRPDTKVIKFGKMMPGNVWKQKLSRCIVCFKICYLPQCFCNTFMRLMHKLTFYVWACFLMGEGSASWVHGCLHFRQVNTVQTSGCLLTYRKTGNPWCRTYLN